MGNSDSLGLGPEHCSRGKGCGRGVYPVAGDLGVSVRVGGQEGYHGADFVGDSRWTLPGTQPSFRSNRSSQKTQTGRGLKSPGPSIPEGCGVY